MKKKIRLILSIVVSLFLVLVLFRKTEWEEVAASIRGVHFGWIFLSQIFAFCSYFLRAKRWSYIVNAVHSVSYRDLFSSTQIGFLANYIVPARIGEAIRSLVLSRLTKIHLSQSLVLVTLDRLTDLFVLIFFVLVSLFAYSGLYDQGIPSGFFSDQADLSISGKMIKTATFSGIIIFLGILATLIILYAYRNTILKFISTRTNKKSGHPLQKMPAFFSKVFEGMKILSSFSDISKTILFSFLVWAMHLFAVAAILKSFHLDVQWYAPFIWVALTAFFISFPVTPGLIGQYHVAIILALFLVVPGIAADKAKAISIAAYLLNLIPIVVLGLFSLHREHLKLTDISRGR